MRNGYRFNQNDFVTGTREDKKGGKTCQSLLRSHSTTLLELTRRLSWNCPIIHYIGSGTCKDLVKISSTTTNCVSKGKK